MIVLVSLWLIPVAPAEAAAYRCLDEDGHTSYSEKPCSVDQRVNKIISGIGGGIEYHCELPKRLARETVETMRAGKPSSHVFKQHGGIHTLSPTAISIINYVYQYKLNYEATTERIVSLTEQRCVVGSFGVTDCSVFPPAFVSSAGGCHGSGTTVASLGNSPYAGSSGNSSSNRQSSTAPSAVVPATEVKRNDESSADCRARIRYKLEGLESEIRNSISAAGKNKLKARQRNLRRSAEQC